MINLSDLMKVLPEEQEARRRKNVFITKEFVHKKKLIYEQM